MSKWPRNVGTCMTCTGSADRYAYGSGGNCRRCYVRLKRIKEAQGWDRNNQASLKGFPDSLRYLVQQPEPPRVALVPDEVNAAEFQAYQKSFVQRQRLQLNTLRRREEIRRLEIKVEPLDLEYKFAEVLHLLRPKAQYPKYASLLADQFDEAQRRLIYALLEEIIEQVPLPHAFGSLALTLL
jgi:hypothetical protein